MRAVLAGTVALVALAACANKAPVQPGATAGGPATVAADGSRPVKSMDGSFDGEMVGTPRPGSKFSRVRIGMGERQVEDLIGRPNDTDAHITGKQFIPFYFGGDTHRMEAFYKGEGILTFSPEHFAGQANTLIKITVNPSETGYAH